MSSVGQAVGMVVGGVAGSFVGMPMLGASIGGMIGGYIDPPKGQNTVGPRLEDLTVQTSTYGAILPRIKGTVAITGNVFWLEGDQIKEHVNTKKVGGKGGPTSKQTTYSYTATFAVSLAHCITEPIAGIRRLWLANTLVYDAGSDNLQSIIASNLQEGIVFKVYDGSDDQKPDPRMQADKGVANVSGYPGRASIFFYDLDLTAHYNNTLMATQVKAEVVCGNSSLDYDVLQTMAGDYATAAGREICSASFGSAKANYSVVKFDPWGGNPISVEFWETEYGVHEEQTGGYSLASVGFAHAPFHTFISESDRPLAMHIEGFDDGYGHTDVKIYWHEFGGTTSVTPLLSHTEFTYLNYSAAVEGSDTFLTYRGGSNIIKLVGTTIVARSAASYRIKHAGLSENYLFGVYDSGYPSASTTIYKFDRTTLALVDTFVQSVTATWAAINVIDDDTFYTLSDDDVYKWAGGVVVSTLSNLLPYTGQENVGVWFNVLSDNPAYSLLLTTDGTSVRTAYVGHSLISAQSAKLHDIITDECALVGIESGDLDLSEMTNHDVRGYRNTGSVRGALEQLQAAFPFDVLQSGYKIKFKDRGGASALTVPESDLGAHTGNDTPIRFSTLLEMPSQVPAKVTFNFLNADREYDIDEQSSAYTAQDVKNSYTVSLPLVMTPTEAKQAADVLLKKEQIERTTVSPFWLPPADNYRKLEAADVIDVIAQGRTHTVRLTRVSNLPDGRVECEGRLTASTAYVSTAEAQESLALGQSLVPLAGSSEATILDIPRIVAAQDVPGMIVGMYGYTSAWPGGVLFRSDDSGQSFSSIVSFANKTEVFSAAEIVAENNGYAIDNSAVLTLTPAWDGADLFSITETQLYAHGNLAAYGAHGRWEIVAFKTVTSSGADFIASTFRRGLYGTEWATGLHQQGDQVVMLDSDNNDFAGLPLTAINSPRLWRGVTSGASLDSAVDISTIYTAVNLKPLAPVDLKGHRDTVTRDWTVSFSPRSRWPVEVFSGLAQPLGESPESYDAEVWSSGYSTLVRTFFGLSSPEFIYPQAQQIADFSSEQVTLRLKIHPVSSVVGRGYPLVTSISRSLNSDPYIDSVTVLMHMDDTGLSDVMGSTVTLTGATRSATQSMAGGYSAYMNGSSQYIKIANSSRIDFGTGDFCIELFQFFNDSSNRGIFQMYPGVPANSTNGLAVGYDGTQFVVYANNAANNCGSYSLATGQWKHIALVRQSGVIQLWVGGAAIGPPISCTVNIVSNDLFLGLYYSSSYTANAYQDEVRIAKVARYISAFTPPTPPLPNP